MSGLGSDPTQRWTVAPGDAAAAAPAVELTGQVLAGRYEVLSLVGRGGMGSVYRVHDRELDEIVALKVLLPEYAAQAGMLEHFRREVKLARRVTHRNVARTFELGEHAGLRFLTMEFVAGEPLSLRLRGGPLPLAAAGPIAIAVCDALQAAHAVGVVHRDIKPDNVLLAGDRVVVTDFGIARLGDDTEASPAGTLAYMAPEQLAGAALSGRADLYALGVMLFEMLTGTLPWTGDGALAVAARRLGEPPPDPRERAPAVSPAAAAVVLRCMSREPGDRFADAAAVAAALRDALARATAGAEALLPAPPVRGASPPARALAVLPLRNLGADADLVDGLHEDLLDALSTLRGVRVLSRGPTLRFRGVDRDPRDIGRELGVDAIVDGSVRRIPTGLRIAVQLVDVATGFQTWSGRYDTAPEGALQVQDQAARAIFAALAPDVLAPERQAPVHPEALDLYLRGRRHGRLAGADELTQAVELFSRAHALEPDNPLIGSGLAMALIRRTYFTPVVVEEAITQARALATAAIERAPRLGEPHLALAQLAVHRGDGAAATRALRAAIACAPNLAEAHDLLGRVLIEAGRVDDGLRRLEVAMTLDPELDGPAWEFVRVAAIAGDWDGVDRWLAKILGPTKRRNGRWLFHIRTAAWRRDAAALQAIADELPGATDMPPLVTALVGGLLEVYLHRRDFTDMNGQLLGSLTIPAIGRRMRHWILQMSAEVAGYLDRTADVLASLRALATNEFFDLLWLEGCPLLAGARRDPAYAPLRALVAARADAIVDAMWGA